MAHPLPDERATPFEPDQPTGDAGEPPRLLFVNQHYWPDVASTGQHLTDLAEYVADEGYDVEVLTSRVAYEGGRVDEPLEEVFQGVRIRRLRTTGFGRSSYLGRIVDYLCFVLQALLHVVFGPRREMVVYLTTPPLLPVLGAVANLLRGQPYGIWSMDLHPDAEEALGVFSDDGWPVRVLHELNDWAHRRAEFVVDLGPYMEERLTEKGVSEEDLHTVPVWNRKDEVKPIPRDDNPFLERFGLEDRFVIMYSGNAGLGHRFRDVLGAMKRLADHPEVFFLFVGGGPRRPEVEAFAERQGITNFAYHDYVERENLKYSLSLAHVHLITLRDSMAGIAAPGKLYGILAAGRPALMVGPTASEPAHTIQEHEVGHVVDPSDPGTEGAEEVTDIIRGYYRVPARAERVGRRARRVFEQHFAAEAVLPRWRRILDEECGREPAATREGAATGATPPARPRARAAGSRP